MTLRSSHRQRTVSVEDLSAEEATALHELRSLFAVKLCRVLEHTPPEERVLTFALATIDFVSLRSVGQLDEWLDRTDRLIAGQGSTEPHAAVASLLSGFFEQVPDNYRRSAGRVRLSDRRHHHAERRKVTQILGRYAKGVVAAAPQAKPGLFLVYGSVAMLFGTEWARFVIDTTREIILSDANRTFRQAIELGPKATVH
jgi:hypothetical protein